METEIEPKPEEIVVRVQTRLEGFLKSFDGNEVNVSDIVRAFPIVMEDVPVLLKVIADQKTELYRLRNTCHPCGSSGKRTYDGDVCDRCAGRGYVPPPCDTCNGHGEVSWMTTMGYDSALCEKCKGEGFVDELEDPDGE